MEWQEAEVMTKQSVFDNPNGDFLGRDNIFKRSCMDDDSNYSYSCMTSCSLIRVTHA